VHDSLRPRADRHVRRRSHSGRLAVKQALFEEIEAYVGDETILASNSSSFPISQTVSGSDARSERWSTHWFIRRILCPPSKSSLTAHQ